MSINNDTVNTFNRDILDLYGCLNSICDDNESNCLDPASLFNVLHLLFEGTAGDSRRELESTNLKSMIKMIQKSIHSRSGIFIREGWTFVKDYLEKFKKNHAFDIVPTNMTSLENVNANINETFPNWHQKDEAFFKKPLSSNCRICIKDQSYFQQNWKIPFLTKNTIFKEFYVGDKTIKIPTMIRDEEEYIQTYYDQKRNILFASLPYASRDYVMFLMMPTVPHTKSQLVDLVTNKIITAEDISDFYLQHGKRQRYDRKEMPKFEFNTQWRINLKKIDSEKYCSISYLKIITSNNLDLRNISKSLDPKSYEGISLTSISDISNTETGTSIKSETSFMQTDGVKRVLRINRSFIYTIVKIIDDRHYIISKLGLFVGPK